MLLYLSSTGVSSVVEILFKKIGRKKTYFIGFICAIIATVGFLIAGPR